MKFIELLQKHHWDDIQAALIRLYPDQGDNLEGYQQVFATLRATEPARSDLCIVIEQVSEEYAGEDYLSVSGRDSTGVSYGIELTDWTEWLGMEIDSQALTQHSELDILAHCLWEMTFFGFSPEDLREVIRSFEESQSGKSEEAMTPKELWQELDAG
jgi:hypothetical protein